MEHQNNAILNSETVNSATLALHKKPGMSGEVQKYQLNIIFPSNFWMKKIVFPISEKFKTETFQ